MAPLTVCPCKIPLKQTSYQVLFQWSEFEPFVFKIFFLLMTHRPRQTSLSLRFLDLACLLNHQTLGRLWRSADFSWVTHCSGIDWCESGCSWKRSRGDRYCSSLYWWTWRSVIWKNHEGFLAIELIYPQFHWRCHKSFVELYFLLLSEPKKCSPFLPELYSRKTLTITHILYITQALNPFLKGFNAVFPPKCLQYTNKVRLVNLCNSDLLDSTNWSGGIQVMMTKGVNDGLNRWK